MVAIRVTGPIKMALVASPSILVDRAVPQMPEDLLHFDCVQYRRGEDKNPVPWHFERGGERREVVVRGPVTVTLPELAVRAALDGLGVAYVSENYANIPNRSGGLIRLLEDWSPITDGLYLCYPWQRQAPAALRSFKELLLLHMIDP